MNNTSSGHHQDETRTPNPSWVRRLAGYCLRHPTRAGLAFGGALVGMVATASMPLIQRSIVDDAILTDRRSIWPLALLLVGAAAVTYLCTFLRRYHGGRLALDVQHDLRTGLFNSLTRLDGARLDAWPTGQIIGRATSDVTLIQGLLQMLPLLVGNLVLFLLSLGAMLLLSPLLTLITLAVAPGLYLVARLSRGKLFPATWLAQQRNGAVAGVVDDAVTGVRVVKGFGQESQELSKLAAASRRLFAARMLTVRLTSRYNPTLQAIPALGQVGVLALGGWLALHGSITLGTFLAFSTYVAQLVGPVRILSNVLTVGQQARASVERVFDLIDAQPDVTDAAHPVTLSRTGAPRVELADVSFGYRADQPVLRGLSLTIEPGETLAVVGTAGSGKSTISLLLGRFYDPTGGSVRIDGHDLREVSLDSLRHATSLVLENSFLFSDSIRANISYGRPDASLDEVVAAARAARADEFITALPNGYDTVVGEQGLTLSGGQRQRVSLARALLTNPRLLVLDDATSAVDARVEAEIHANLDAFVEDRTTLVIAHRRSTLALADRIAVLDEGRLVDIGRHDELEARCPLYRLLLSGPSLSNLTDDTELTDDSDEIGPLEETEAPQLNGITPELWPRTGSAQPEDLTNAATATVMSPAAAVPMPRGGGGRGGGGFGAGAMVSGALAGMPADDRLLARVEALGPAVDLPDVDEEAVQAADPGFTLTRLLRPLAGPLLIALLLVAVDAAATLVLPVLTRTGVDHGVARGSEAVILAVSLIGLLVVLGDLAVNVTQAMVAGRTGERLLYTLRLKTFAHLQRLGLDYYEREMSGRIMTRMTTDIDAFSTFLQTGLTTAAVSVLTFAGILVALLVINIELGLVIVATLPLMLIATLWFRKVSAVAYLEAREKVSVVNADLQENVAGMRITQAYRREVHNRARFAQRSDDYNVSRTRAQRYIATYFPFVQFLSTVAAALVLVVGDPLVRTGALTAGALIAYLLYIDMFFSPIQQLSQVFDGYQQAAVGLRRIRELLRTPTTTPATDRPVPVPERLAGTIEFRDVRFAYSGAETEALSGFTMEVEPGETVALVGQTGAGKSTVVKLVSRFYDATSGSVRVDGVDLREYNLASYRHRLGVIPQEPYLFPGTVREAIAYGRPEASDAEVESAARAVGAHTMIARLPGGYHHDVDERGRNLSAGQRQLIALARAELVDPDILLMDEATAALDLATEAVVTDAIDRLTRRRTTLVVAHRLTTAARADRIVMVGQGRVLESGTHEQLLAAGGAYAAQWQAYVGDGHIGDEAATTRR